MTPAAVLANQLNGRRSRGPGEEAKKRTRFNARVHDLRAESELLPGEDSAELYRRLEVWPQLMNAQDELQVSVAQRVVHMGWRLERAERSEDADTRRRSLGIAQSAEDQRAEQARLLGLELDSDVDPDGVVRKLLRTPEGCTLLIKEWTSFKESQDRYHTLVWSRRERLFHLLGKRLVDFFHGDPVINDWVATLLGTVYGDFGERKVESLTEVLFGLRPDWMNDLEFAGRMTVLARQLPDKATATHRIRTYIDDVIEELNGWLEQAESNAEFLLELDQQAAWVNDSPEGARRLNYKLGHHRSFDAACRRLEALQKDNPAGGKSTRSDAPVEPVVANEPVVLDPGAAADPVTKPDTPAATDGGSVTITNDPIRDDFAAAVTKPDTLASTEDGSVTITNDPIRSSLPALLAAILVPDDVSTVREGLALPDLVSPSVSVGEDWSVDAWTAARRAPRADLPVLLQPSPPVPDTSGIGGQRTGEPPPDRPPP